VSRPDLLIPYYQLSNSPPQDPDSTQQPKSNEPTLPAGGEVVTKGPSGKAKDNLLLGDLNYKQNKYAEAVQAYTAALKVLGDNNKSVEYAQVCQKLAQALLAEGKVDEAKKYLDLVIEQKKAAPPAALPKDPAPAALPSKLILSAPKKLLDQVGAGKIAFEDFKKDATVEVYPFAGPEKDTQEKGNK
jgi:tetratricopeptide (TPR) repeat protein